jgi:hypothetical protein
MASTRATLLFALTTFGLVSDWAAAIGSSLGKLVDTVCSFLSGVSNEWYFLSDVLIPLPASQYKNIKNNVPTRHSILWSYNSGSGTLKRGGPRAPPAITTFHPDWLSVMIEINGEEYSMDHWVQNFAYERSNFDWFSPFVFATCWSIYSKIWFTRHDDVQLHIITNMGDRVSFSVGEEWGEDWIQTLMQGNDEEGLEDAEVNEVVEEMTSDEGEETSEEEDEEDDSKDEDYVPEEDDDDDSEDDEGDEEDGEENEEGNQPAIEELTTTEPVSAGEVEVTAVAETVTATEAVEPVAAEAPEAAPTDLAEID